VRAEARRGHAGRARCARRRRGACAQQDEAGLVLLAPESRDPRDWDFVFPGYYGPDVEFIDRALQQTFDRIAVDAGKVAIEGFSDGASYAVTLGLANGDLSTT
jgi:phospholipase/carboxylesterase